MSEIWKPVTGFEGLYECSNRGRVRSLVNPHKNPRTIPKILKPAKTRDGYLIVGLSKDGKRTIKKVHRIVAEAFLENPLNLPEVNHRDEDKTNNSVFIDENGNIVQEKSNLEWMSHLDNTRYGTGIERKAKALMNHPKRSKKVYQYDLEGDLVKEWLSAHEVERQTGWSQGSISACCRGKYKTMYGFIWRYAEAKETA